MANSTGVTWANIASMIIAAASVFIAAASWWVSYRQSEVISANQRPWIGAPKVIIVNEGNDIRDLRFELKNTGHIPTLATQVKFDFVPQAGFEHQIKPLCDKHKAEIEKQGWSIEFSVTPEATYVANHPVGLDNHLGRLEDKPHVIGCVSYTWITDKSTIHQTGFAAPLVWNEGNNKRWTAPISYTLAPN